MRKLFTALFLITALFGFAGAAQALTISPAKLELSSDPGKTISGQFTLINEQEDTKTFYSSAENFEAQGETGTPNFTPGNTGLASWVSAPAAITLKKGEQVTVPFKISVPVDADPGGHFAALFLSTAPPATEKSQVSVGAKVGVLILLRVSGEVKEGGGILNFSSQDKQRFFTSLPIHFVYRFNNGGNDRIKPEGVVQVTNTIGMKSAILNANPNQGNILPGSTRRFEVVWGPSAAESADAGFFTMVGREWNNFAFGKYTAHLDLQYGSAKKAESSYTFFVLPWHLMIVVIVLLAFVFFGLAFALKRYNRWIVRKAQGVNNQDRSGGAK